MPMASLSQRAWSVIFGYNLERLCTCVSACQVSMIDDAQVDVLEIVLISSALRMPIVDEASRGQVMPRHWNPSRLGGVLSVAAAGLSCASG